ncbi:MAG TPA: TIGR03066 family protein [Gemmata sp.]|nr:TIGR03066 family protein [Gemmata sp.]
MRTLFGVGMVLALVGGVAAADDKIDAKKLLGKWEHKEMMFVVTFAKDGKVAIEGGDLKIDGTYKLDGSKLTMKIKFGDEEKEMKRTITKLSDTELTSTDDDKKDDKGDTLVRVKDEKKDKKDK